MINIHHKKLDNMWYAAALEHDKVFATSFASTESEALKCLLKELPNYLSFQIAENPNLLAEKLLATSNSIFMGKNTSWNFKLEMAHLPKYSRKVLGLLKKVPVGYVTTYGALARTTEGGPRAVGRVMATNPFAPLIPCHRVVMSDFSLGGYGGGLDIKRGILKREDRGYKEPSMMNVDDLVLAIYPVGFLWKD
jgi:O-6-methylguanine DNA methyltransferase